VFGTGAKIVQKEGVMALWKGLLPPVVASTPMYALCFFGYGVGKNLFCDDDAFEEGNFKLGQIGMAGAFSAVFTTPVMAPQERLKCVLQTQKPGPDGKLPSMSHVASSLYKEGGLMNLLRGSGVTVLRDSSASFMYFTTYEIMKYKMRQYSSNGELHLGHFIIAGGVAGIMNWVRVCVCVCVCVNQTCQCVSIKHAMPLSYTSTIHPLTYTQVPAIPFDVLKTNYQTAPIGKYTGCFLGARPVYKTLIAEGGIRALYKGTAPIFIRAFPANAACFSGYELSLKLLSMMGLS